VDLDWLGQAPVPATTGVSWGVPWPRGAVPKNQTFTLTTGAGRTLPLQTWPLAYWPDGSLKWSGFATVAGPEDAGAFTLAPGPVAPAAAGPAGAAVVRVRRSETAIEVDTGRLRARVGQWGGGLDRFAGGRGARGRAARAAGLRGAGSD
jgi:hypothetical protein